jgi:VWFA-related protein
MNTRWRACLAVVLCVPVLAFARHSPTSSPPTAQSDKAPNSDAPEGLLKLDVVVTDQSGRPATGLAAKDFTLLDNGQPSKIVSFHAFDGIAAKPDPPVEVILVIDELQVPADLVRHERLSVEAFLRQHGGRLAQPVSIFSLAASGFWQLAEPSRDGIALAAEVEHNRLVRLIRRIKGSLRGDVPASLSLKDPPVLEALEAIGALATAARRRPGRKLLLWVGPGWGIGSGTYAESTVSKERDFYTIRWFSTLMREAHVALYSFSVGESNPRSQSYLGYLHGIQSTKEANAMLFYRKVIAVQSGGRVLDRSDDVVAQIESCFRDAGAFYTLSFDASHADHPAEYHDLQVEIDVPGLTARTNTGYYDQPFYSDEPDPAIKPVAVEQLEHVLEGFQGDRDSDEARQLSELELTERMSEAKLARWMASLRGKKTRQALTALADVSAFLDPPPAEIAADAPPDAAARQRILSLAADYLNTTIPRLPDFFATRATVRYEQTQLFDEATTKIDNQPMHVADSYSESVIYRNGSEVADSGAGRHTKRIGKEPYLITYGTFGPILGFVHDALAVPGDLTWSRWEKAAGGPRAVFRYRIPAARSLFQTWGCCLPDGDGTGGFQRLAGYHGEIAIDPQSGAILRLQAEADLKGFVPAARSGIVVSYGPVEIGGKTYICPVKSVSRMRMRSVADLGEWDESFRTYGPHATMLNDITYEDYHKFRGEARVLPGYDSAPKPE